METDVHETAEGTGVYSGIGQGWKGCATAVAGVRIPNETERRASGVAMSMTQQKEEGDWVRKSSSVVVVSVKAVPDVEI